MEGQFSEKENRNERIFEGWLACYTQDEIAEREGITKETVSAVCQKIADSQISDKPTALFEETDKDGNHTFQWPSYNFWTKRGIVRLASPFDK